MTDEISNERRRLFIAIQVPDAVREEMLRVQRELQSRIPDGVVRWTNPEQFHLTLKFLGNVPSGSLPALQEAVRAVCADASPLRLQARGAGFFPNARSPRVLWIGIHDSENRLPALQLEIENAVQPFTSEPAGEHFAGHVTLGRFKSINRFNVKDLRVHAERMENRVFGEWTANEIGIIRSELLEIGPRHTPVAALRLGTEIAL